MALCMTCILPWFFVSELKLRLLLSFKAWGKIEKLRSFAAQQARRQDDNPSVVCKRMNAGVDESGGKPPHSKVAILGAYASNQLQ